MFTPEIMDWIVRSIVALGVPGLIGKYLYDGRRSRRRERAEVDVLEGTTPDKIRASSITTLESQMVAMTKAFDVERTAKDKTIAFQSEQLDHERAYSGSRDAVITELRARVDALQAQLAEVAVKLAELQTDTII